MSEEYKVKAHGFGSLDDPITTGEWQGAHFRFSPHTPFEYAKNGYNYPAGIYFKKDATQELFSVKNLQDRKLFAGGFAVPNGA